MSQGRSNDLHHLGVHHPPFTIEGGVDDIRGIQDIGAGTKRKEDSSSSNQGKKPKTSVSHGHQRHGQGYQDQGQDGAFSQAGQVICYLCRQPGHFRRDFHGGRNPKVMGHLSPNHQ